MIQTTSLALSKKLYEMFGWGGEDCDQLIEKLNPHTGKVIKPFNGINADKQHIVSYGVSRGHINSRNRGEESITPLYNLAYLLEKLPNEHPEDHDHGLYLSVFDNLWIAGYRHYDYTIDSVDADNPTEAAGLLCLELGEKGLLK